MPPHPTHSFFKVRNIDILDKFGYNIIKKGFQRIAAPMSKGRLSQKHFKLTNAGSRDKGKGQA